MTNKRDKAKELDREISKQRHIINTARTAQANAEEELSQMAEKLEPDPECSHSISHTVNGLEICAWCCTGKYKWLDL